MAAGSGKARARERSQRNSEDLKRRGFPHGKRQSRPYPNSGGTTMTSGPGSNKYQRLVSRFLGKK